ncbi:23392_t:CDS:2 [Cetraspora pellucida]|uniref:23392_t:CDS:1 n=1 Tax=Cetraspora pellucida TaxID=1433469 RepID=A0A9N9CYS2_9GLOM|nr:23392_t:CDS:2 [Cetraspora pellucida]
MILLYYNNKIVKDSEIEEEETEYNLDIIECFDHDNIVFLNDENIQDNELDEKSQIAADLVRGWGHKGYKDINDRLNSVADEVSENINENLNNT